MGEHLYTGGTPVQEHQWGNTCTLGEHLYTGGTPVKPVQLILYRLQEASLKQQLESTEGSPDLQGEVRGLQAQVQEEKERTAVAQSQLGSLQKEMEEEREKTNQERQRYKG